jgi:ubiquinol-cytochrome c reductase cytochrome b subunit
MRLWVLAALPLLSIASYASSRDQRDHGAAVYADSGCAHCHVVGNTGGHKGPDLSGVGRRLKVAQMRQQIVDGSKQMPPFGEELPNADLRDLLAYLRSCREKSK